MQVMPSNGPHVRPQPAEAVESLKSREAGDQGRSAQQSNEVAERRPGDLDEAVEKMNEVAKALNHALQFEVVKPNRIVIRVVDTKTGEVLRQVPPEQLLDAFYRMEETLGVLMDEKA